MKFRNMTGKMRIVRIGDRTFKDVEHGEIVDLPMEQGLKYGFLTVRDGVELKDKAPEKPPEKEESPAAKEELKPEDAKENVDSATKEEEFKEWLMSLKYFGIKTVKDLMKDYKTKDELRIALVSGEHIQLRDDKVEILRKELGV